ncbi:MAG: hypothetical protein K8U57_31595 [Planctomycetes bacterium]|nr:hypothetical protein [Planctomycetota bacterium]
MDALAKLGKTIARTKKELEKRPERPVPLKVNPSNIPLELQRVPHWMVWSYEWRAKNKKKPQGPGQWTKVPKQARGWHLPDKPSNGKSTDPAYWTTLGNAVFYHFEHGGVDGLGFVATAETNLFGVDLDHCRDRGTGVIEDWARAIIDQLDTYTEVSPSGTGIRMFLRGQKPDGRKKKGNVEMYNWGRFLTVTGQHVSGTPETVTERPEAVLRFRDQYLPPDVLPPKKRSRVTTPGIDLEPEPIADGDTTPDRTGPVLLHPLGPLGATRLGRRDATGGGDHSRADSARTTNDKTTWSDVSRQIKARLLSDTYVAHYAAMGLIFHPTPRANPSGYVQCWDAAKRKYKSDGIHTKTGYWKDFNGNIGVSFLEYYARYHGVGDWKGAQRHLAQAFGIPIPGGYDWVATSRPLPSPTAEPKRKPIKQKASDYSEFVPKLVAHAIANGAHAWLAENIHVGKFALRKINIGTWDQDDQSYFVRWGADPCTIWPEYHLIEGKLVPVSFIRRSKTIPGDDGKRIIAGGVRGMTIANGWIKRANKTGRLLITDGGSDTAAATTMGLAAIGSPQSGSAVVRDHVVPMILAAIRTKKLRADITIFVTQDVNHDGTHDEGTATICQWIADAIGRPCWRRLCPSISENGGDFAKDVRTWLAAKLPNAHEIAEGDADALGIQFLEETIGYPDVSWPRSRVFHPAAPVVVEVVAEQPKPATAPPAAVEVDEPAIGPAKFDDLVEKPKPAATPPLAADVAPPAAVEPAAEPIPAVEPPTERRQYPSSLVLRERDADASPVAVASPRVFTPGCDEWSSTTLYRLRGLSRVPCPREGHKSCSHRRDSAVGIGIKTTCMGWRCHACLPRRRLRWATHVRHIFSGHVTAIGELYVWRGLLADFNRAGRKWIYKQDGRYIRMELPGGKALVVSTVSHKGAKPITAEAADRVMVRLIAGYKPPAGTGKVMPLQASDDWGLHERGSGQYYVVCDFREPKRAYGVMRQMGVEVDEGDKFAPYKFPEFWNHDDCEWCQKWAATGDPPPGFKRGERVQDYDAAFKELLVMAEATPGSFEDGDWGD